MKANKFKADSKIIKAISENLLASSLEVKKYFFEDINKKIIQKENTETIAKLILYLQDQEL